MILYLIKEDRYFSTILPDKVKGQYWIKDFDSYGNERKLFSVEALGNEWIVKSNKIACITDENGNAVKNTVVHPMSFLNVSIQGVTQRVILFAEPISEERGSYTKVMVRERCSFKLGRSDENDIIIRNEFVSSKHAVLQYDGANWSVQDQSSTNGTYVNSVRVMSKVLTPGDCVFVMGLKIIIGKQFFAINNPDHCVQIQSSMLKKYTPQQIDTSKEYDDDVMQEFFFRSPRLMRDLVPQEIEIDEPPKPEKANETPVALVLGPAITMGMASTSMGVFSVINVLGNGGKITQALPMLIMAFSMLLGSIMWPILSRKHDKKMHRIKEGKRQAKYLEYLETIKDRIRLIVADQKNIMDSNAVSLDECTTRIVQRKTNLWERTHEHNDFLKMRVGKGNVPAELTIHYPKKKFSLEDDNLQNAMLAIGAERYVLNDVPVSVSLKEHQNVGIVGSYVDRMNMLKSIILQAISLHSYDELKICLICDEEMMQEFSFVKFLPHIWSNDRTERYLASTSSEARELSAMLEKILYEENVDDEDEDKKGVQEHYLIIAASMKRADACDSYRKLLGDLEERDVSIISLGNKLHELPKEAKYIIDLKDSNQGMLFDKDDVSGNRIAFNIEHVKDDNLDVIAEEIANILLDVEGQKYALPNMMTFLEMFEVGKIEHLNSLTRWKDNNPTKSLQAPIGVGVTGESFVLDLHEKNHGPHGLVAGMTGSGKSEFIITYILSLAVNYHPDEVAFVLIDYKGGGLAGAFEDEEKGIKLPHLAGTITNLDGSAVRRSLISIQSELRRRQGIFNEARKIANEGTMDIYKYQQLYREGLVTEPIPHLFIISDEFAELKAQQPEFMEQLISAARIGRSLGVHLILATQKPSGVVDDQIWSNSKFRVCLKVQDRSDSQDMIKRSDAAEISQTGRFYLQVGFNELFAMGQSAWCGAEYIPTETLEKSLDNSIQVVDNLGRPIVEMKPVVKNDSNEKHITQVVGIVQYLSDLAREEQVQVKPLWMPVIPSHIYIDELEEKYNFVPDDMNLKPIVGEYDDPYNQSQNALYVPLSEDGNCLIYGAVGSGKGVFLTSMIYSLLKNYTPEKLCIYIMDFGAETLRAFEKAPQVGGVALISEEEKVMNLLKLLRTEITERKKKFADAGGDYRSYCRQSKEAVPHIVVFLNNYAAFREQYEDYEYEIQSLTQDGLKYGMHFVITATATNAVRYTMLQNFKMIMSMQLNDESEYSMVLGRTEIYPSHYVGRGLFKGEMMYEFQTAYVAKSEDDLNYIREFCKGLSQKIAYRAKQIPVLPKLLDSNELMSRPYDMTSVPFAIAKNDLHVCTMNLEKTYIYPIMANELNDTTVFIEEYEKILRTLPVEINVWDETTEIEKAVVDCFNDMVERNNIYKDNDLKISVLEPYNHRMFIINGIKMVYDRLSEDGKDKLSALLENGQGIYKMHFIMSDSATAYIEYKYEEWYKKHIRDSEWLWIGDGLSDQSTMNINIMPSRFYTEINTLYGYIVSKGKPTLVKVLSTEEE